MIDCPSGLPSAAECAQAKVIAAQVSFVSTGADQQGVLVQAPTPVPVGKHWIVLLASLIGDMPGAPGTNDSAIFGMFIANPAKIGGDNGIVFQQPGGAVDQTPGMTYVTQNQMIGIPTELTGLSVQTAIASLPGPYVIVPSGAVLCGLWTPAAAGNGVLSLNFLYIQRDNPAC
jgi:hypothetical protein